jgi:hypothetical protein
MAIDYRNAHRSVPAGGATRAAVPRSDENTKGMGAWGVARILTSFLSSVARAASASTSDPVLLVGAPLPLASLALVMSRRAKSMRIDPVVALRE